MKIKLLLLLFALPVSIVAKPKEPVQPPATQPLINKDLARSKALFDQGEAYYKLGQYQQALEAYQEAYLLSKAPLFLLNIGQCYRYLGKTVEAIHSYEAFIREDPKSPYRADIEAKIDELNIYLQQKLHEETSLPTIMVTPTEKPLNKKLLIGASAGGATLLGLGLTTFLVYRPPRSDGGAEVVDLRGAK